MSEQSISEMSSQSIGTLIGADVVVNGSIQSITGNPSLRMVVMGRVNGDIKTDGILEIGAGAAVFPQTSIECAEIVIAGSVTGENTSIHTDLFILQSSGRVDVNTLCLPPGGLEQLRGSVLNARLDMSPSADAPSAQVSSAPTPVVQAPTQVTAKLDILSAPDELRPMYVPSQFSPRVDWSDPTELAGSLPAFSQSSSTVQPNQP